jgi:hypothetical protein
MSAMRFHESSHRLTLSKAAWAAAARSARAAIPGLMVKGLLLPAAALARRAAEFERRAA